ncbi:triose-phosphate isomerase [Buchnera aphidicola]|uniref:Triosephosphate isomerase n=1 Tax=Buchnera aphidicola (Anoecia oenotherae) TaxID=1241833 RepID=A0A4D6XRE2_9GAMM|nr:triose-phosphate isomerase [Buchnera aphidicola]QCI19366.1 triose-phosphate isomerase [Buchnera aphidicola (Anoecia oenotherae)]
MKKKTTLPIIIGNWKLNGTKNKLNSFFKFIKDKSLKIKKNLTILALPNIYLNYAQELVSKLNINCKISAQNIDIHKQGPYTGETSVNMLSDINIKYTIIGHAERRYYHSENNDIIAKKFILSKQKGIIPILCLGENQLEKDCGKTEEIILSQLNAIASIDKQNKTIFNNSIIAYEPIWSIGSKKSADPDLIQQLHTFIKNYVIKFQNFNIDNFYIIYGGSVNEENVNEFLNKKNVDGCLIGNASLNKKIFNNILVKSNKIDK